MSLAFGAPNLTRIFGCFDRVRQSRYFFNMLGGFVGSIVSLGLVSLPVLFDKYRVASHLFLHRVRMQLGSGQPVATSCSPAPRPGKPDLAPNTASQDNVFPRNDTER